MSSNTQLIKTGARWGTLGAVPGTIVGATGLRDSREAMAAAPSFVRGVTQVVAAPGAGWGSALRHVGGATSGALGKLVPPSLYVTRFPDKLADWSASAYGYFAQHVPWVNEKELAGRLPGAPYPDARCDWQAPAADCPAPLGYVHAATVAPWMYAVSCTLGGAAAGAAVGALTWRFVPHWIAAIPVEDLNYSGMRCAGGLDKIALRRVVAAARRLCEARQAARLTADDASDASFATATEEQPLLPS